jgi:hypothetical protein
VGGEVLDDPDVLDAGRERAEALRGDQEGLADLAIEDPTAKFDERRVAALDVPHGSSHACGLDHADDGCGSVSVGGQRLLDQDVDARAGEAFDDALVVLRGNGDDREVRARSREQRVEGLVHSVRVGHDAVAVQQRVHRADERDAVHRLQESRVMATHHAQANHGALERRVRRGGCGRGRHKAVTLIGA